MRLAVEGQTTEKLIEEVQQIAEQSTVEVSVIEVDLRDLRSNIMTLAE